MRRYPDAPLLRRCWELRDACTTCDALYVALAEALDASIVTRDARLARAVAGLVDVVVPSAGTHARRPLAAPARRPRPSGASTDS